MKMLSTQRCTEFSVQRKSDSDGSVLQWFGVYVRRARSNWAALDEGTINQVEAIVTDRV